MENQEWIKKQKNITNFNKRVNKMNIIEAIKSGKDFRRSIWKSNWYAHVTRFYEIRIEGHNNDRVIPNCEDILADDWEVKEEEKTTFDPTKPVQTKDGREARVICSDFNRDLGGKTIISLIKKEENLEYIGIHLINGYCISDFEDHLINIPEPKLIDINVGGVYKEISGDIHICVNKIDETRNYSTFYSLNIGHSGSYLFDLHRDRIIEHLGDIQDLNPYIKDKLK